MKCDVRGRHILRPESEAAQAPSATNGWEACFRGARAAKEKEQEVRWWARGSQPKNKETQRQPRGMRKKKPDRKMKEKKQQEKTNLRCLEELLWAVVRSGRSRGCVASLLSYKHIVFRHLASLTSLTDGRWHLLFSCKAYGRDRIVHR